MFSLTELGRDPKSGRLGINKSFERIYISKDIDLSIQADPYSYCQPKKYIHPHDYTSYELAFIYIPNERCFYPKLTPTYMHKYMEVTNSNVDGIYMYVPVHIIEQLVRDMRLLYSEEITEEKTEEEKTEEETEEKTPTAIIKNESDWYIVSNSDYE